MTLRLAWRNLWRNPRRTTVVVTAVAVGIAGVVFSMAINFGMVVQMVDKAIEIDLGHIQIHAAGFDENPELRVRLKDGGRGSERVLADLAGVAAYARRVRGEGLISSPRASAGVSVVGVEPRREAAITSIADSMTAGSYLNGDKRRVLLGEELARRLKVGVGDKVVLSVQDLSGDLAGEALRVGGLFRTVSTELDRSTIFVRIEEGQALLGFDEAVTEVVVLTEGRSRIPAVRAALEDRLEEVEVRTWEELRPILVYLVETFDQQAIAVYVAVFVAMAFGIANVMLMTIFERVREIGILTAVGMGRGRLVAMIVLESQLVTLAGLSLGYAIAFVGVELMSDGLDLSAFAEGLGSFGVGTRIIPVVRAMDIVIPTAVAIATALLSSLWPALRAVRLKPAEAVRHV